MLAALPTAVIRDLLQFLVQTALVNLVAARGRHPRLPAGGQLSALAQDLARVVAQRAHVQPLRLPVRVGVVTVAARIALAVAHVAPVRRRVHGAGEPCRVDEALHHQQWMAILPEPVVAQPAQHRAHHAGAEIRKYAALAQHQEPGVVRNQVQAPEHLLAAPSNPAIARGTLERCRLPAGQRYPAATPLRHIAQPAPGKPLEPQVVMLIHQHVPFDPFVRSHQPHHHLGQRKTCRRCRRQRLLAQLLKLHDHSLTTRSQDYQPLQHGIALLSSVGRSSGVHKDDARRGERLSAAAAQADWPGPFIIDELPYLIVADPSVTGVLQNWLDRPARRPCVVVSGSSQVSTWWTRAR